MRLIAGLGNPGRRYAESRHNVGFWVIDRLAARAGVSFRFQQGAYVTRTSAGSEDLIFVKPDEYMNESGPAVTRMIEEFGLSLDDVIVVHDDLDLDPGRVRLKARGGHGGHNGVLSLIESLQNDGFARVKIGVGRPPQGMDAADYVLIPVSCDERRVLDKAIDVAVSAVDCWIVDGLAAAMNRFNAAPSGEIP